MVSTILTACDDGSSSPSLTGSPATTATVGQAYRFQPRLVNIRQGRSLSFTISNKPSWASFDNRSGQLSGTPTASQVGVFHAIQISALEGTAHASLPPFSITVVPPRPVSTTNSVTVSWQSPADNTDGSIASNLGGYKIYYGEAPRNYSSTIKIPNPGLTTYVVENLSPGQYYFAVTAYNSLGEESDFSPEVSTIVD
jgi:hypothetical protein